jgi:hypothetical protein
MKRPLHAVGEGPPEKRLARKDGPPEQRDRTPPGWPLFPILPPMATGDGPPEDPQASGATPDWDTLHFPTVSPPADDSADSGDEGSDQSSGAFPTWDDLHLPSEPSADLQGLPPSTPPAEGTILVQWVSMVDACPVCLANMEVGAVPQGTVFPSGHSTPPAHPFCRCSLQVGSHPLFPLGNGWSGLVP